jgi:hypothetical protein
MYQRFVSSVEISYVTTVLLVLSSVTEDSNHDSWVSSSEIPASLTSSLREHRVSSTSPAVVKGKVVPVLDYVLTLRYEDEWGSGCSDPYI